MSARESRMGRINPIFIDPTLLSLLKDSVDQTSAPGQTGGKILHHKAMWQKLTADPHILNIVSGWEIPFHSRPYQPSPSKPLPHSEQEQIAIDQEIFEMHQMGVITQVTHSSDQFVSSIFTRPKKGGKVRTIINLKKLNQFIPYQHFQMEGLKQAKHMLHQGDLLVKIDLKNAYWSVPIAQKDQKYLRFEWRGHLWQFTVLAFGLGPAPRIFTKLMKLPITTLRRLMIKAIIYLDDMLLVGSSMTEALRARDSTIFLLEKLGFTINWAKSCVTPSPRCEFLGMILDTTNMTIILPREKASEISTLCREAREKGILSLKALASLIGKLYATLPAISIAPIQLRFLQQDLIRAQREGKSFTDQTNLSQNSIRELSWWIENVELLEGKPLSLQPPDVIINTDASSRIGWGASSEGGLNAKGLWTVMEKKKFHINELELIAVELALKSFLRDRNSIHVHMRIDNVSALTYLVKMGGTRSDTLTVIAKRIWGFLHERCISLTAEWIPSKLNIEADALSRANPNSSEWKLAPALFHRISKELGQPKVDCFASRACHQLPQYMSWTPDPESIAIDALSQRWTKLNPYLFPPFCLIGAVLRKVSRDRVRRAILIAPVWSGQPWFPYLLQQCTGPPLIFHCRETTLTRPTGEQHPLCGKLMLGAFPISGLKAKALEFRRGLNPLSPNLEEKALEVLTRGPGRGGVLGVCDGVLIPAVHL